MIFLNSAFEEDKKRKEQENQERAKKEEEQRKEEEQKREAQKQQEEKEKEEDEIKEQNKDEENDEKKENQNVLGSGNDLPITDNQSLNWAEVEDDSFKNNQTFSNYDNSLKTRVGTESESEPSDKGSQTGEQKNKERRYKTYSNYNKYIERIDFGYIRRMAMKKSGVESTDIVRAYKNVRLYADASGLIVAARNMKLKSVIKKISDSEKDIASQVMKTFRADGKFEADRDIKDISGFRDFKKMIDKELLAETGFDVSKMSSKQIYKKMFSKKINRVIFSEDVIANMSRADSLAYASATMHKYMGSQDNVDIARGKRDRSIVRITDRLMGGDVDIWNGSRYVRDVRKALKKIRRYYKSGKETYIRSKIKISPKKTAYEKPVTLKTNADAKVLTSQTAKTKEPAKLSQKMSSVREKYSQLLAKFAPKAATQSAIAGSSAAGATAATSATAATGATVTASGAGTAAAAAGGSSGILIVGIVIVVIVLLLFVVLLISAAAGSISAGFSKDDNGKTKLQACVDVLIKHDEALISMMEDGVSKKEAEELSVNLYTDLNAYSTTQYRNPITGATLATSPTYDANNNVLVSFYDSKGNRLTYFESNAKDIMCATATVIGNDFDNFYRTAKRYAENLWYDTHEVKMSWVTDENGNLKITSCPCGKTYAVVTNTIHTEETIDNGIVFSVNYVYQRLKDEEVSVNELTYQYLISWHNVVSDEQNENSDEYLKILAEIKDSVANGTFLGYESSNGITWTSFSGDFKDGYYYKFESSVWESDIKKEIDSGLKNNTLFCYKTENDTLFTLYKENTLKDGKYRFCAGTAKYEISITTHYINDDLSNPYNSSLFAVDSFTNDPANAEFWNGREDGFFKTFFTNVGLSGSFTKLTNETVWNGSTFVTYEPWELGSDNKIERIWWDMWTDANKETALCYYNDDWYDLYGIKFNYSSRGDTVNDSQINDFIGDTQGDVAEILKFAMGTVGRIPYYWGGKQTTTEQYINHQDMTVEEFIDTYYPHFGTPATIQSNGYPKSINNWTGSIDKKRNLIGLDCSGWVCFVYANFGYKLNTNGTWGLATEGTAVSYYDLKPGDLLINTNDASTAHVVMFVCWDNEQKSSYTTVESAGSSGAVLKSNVKKTWEYYRRIID